jgi:hypothetical protein
MQQSSSSIFASSTRTPLRAPLGDEGTQRLRRVARCNVEIYSTKAKIRRRTIASSHSFDAQPPDSGLVISRIYRSPHTGISRVPWTNLSILPSITSWTRDTGKTPLFASESLVKSDGGT